jgi:ribonuclease VapC
MNWNDSPSLTRLNMTQFALISAASLLEASIVIESRYGIEAGDDLDQMVKQLGLEIEPVTVVQVAIARYAYRTYGEGKHPAALNFGDCFAYALAKDTGEPLLFKGDDFSRTDITVV